MSIDATNESDGQKESTRDSGNFFSVIMNYAEEVTSSRSLNFAVCPVVFLAAATFLVPLDLLDNCMY